MDKSEIKAWVDENIEARLKLFGIPHWSVHVYYDTISDENCVMQCIPFPKYETAEITIDYTKVEDAADLEKSINHELMHILHSPFRLLWCTALELMHTDEQINVFKEILSYSEEQTVKNLERMHRQHKEFYSKD